MMLLRLPLVPSTHGCLPYTHPRWLGTMSPQSLQYRHTQDVKAREGKKKEVEHEQCDVNYLQIRPNNLWTDKYECQCQFSKSHKGQKTFVHTFSLHQQNVPVVIATKPSLPFHIVPPYAVSHWWAASFSANTLFY